jgi:hypothetical protein
MEPIPTMYDLISDGVAPKFMAACLFTASALRVILGTTGVDGHGQQSSCAGLSSTPAG